MILLAIGAGIAAAIPAIGGFSHAPPAGQYLGYQYNTDDHMVYAAWMRQAMDGNLLMDNRFTTDHQPGLTIHLYYFVLGLLSKLFGIALVANTARIGFGVAFIFLLHRLVLRLDASFYARKLAMALVVFGGGLGFLVWHSFGEQIVRPAPDILSAPMLGRLPTDVWQPEAFVFPSMLTNGLFTVSLCLIMTVLLAVLCARQTWLRVGVGALASLVLMNIHSYDMLLVGFILFGLLVMEAARRALTKGWVVRSLVIAAGAIPSALWFMYVLAHDPVFQARAATETYSPNFRQVLFGYLPFMVLGLIALVARAGATEREKTRRILGALIALSVIGAFTYFAKDHASGYFLSPFTWGIAFVAMLVALVLLVDENPAWNTVASWALLGTVAIYFPGLFQRKLAMGLSIPWAILAALGIAYLGRSQERYSRNLATALVVILVSASSFRWLLRETDFIRWNVSRTTVQPVFLNSDVVQILDALNGINETKVVVAPPGIPAEQLNPDTQNPEPDVFLSPIMPDLNPIVSGLTGSYTYAGHWSETPNYDARRAELSRLFYGHASSEVRIQALHDLGAQYVIAPVPQAFPELKLFDFSSAGQILVDGNQFRLIRLKS